LEGEPMSQIVEQHHGEAGDRSQGTHVLMPAPSFWPMVCAVGITFSMAGLVTHWAVSIVGGLILARAVFGWWSDVIPFEKHEEMPIHAELRPAPIIVEERSVIRLQVGQGQHRIRIPEKVHPYSSGLWGGLAGGAAMAGLACLYGLLARDSVWYPVNLLAGVVIPGMGELTVEQLRAFHGLPFVAACIGHAILSMLMGVLYSVLLPMFPKYAPVWAGFLMPLLWSGLIGTTLEILNPALNSRISWPWFVACQLGFGLVGGFVIAHGRKIESMQSWGLAERAEIEAPGLSPEREDQPE
jgi:hypothetical protein